MNEILTPCILQTIIICVSLLLALLCITSLIKSLYGAKDNCDNCDRKKHLSYKFVIGILIFLLVILFSHKFYANDNVFNFMSFASAIISIILAVLTIIYTYYTQGTTSSAAEKIEKASSEMKQVVNSISNAKQTYDYSAETLNEKMQDILKRVKGISHKVGADTDYETVGDLKGSSELNKFKDVVLSEFNNDNSNAGAVLLYLCSKIKETGQACNLKNLFEEDTIMYFFGYIVALNAIGFTVIDIDMTTQIIKSADIVDDLIDGAKQRIEIESKNKFIIEHKQKIDDYFAAKE